MDTQTLTLISLLIHVPVVVAWVSLAAFEFAAASLPSLRLAQRLTFIRGMRSLTVLLVVVIMVTGVWQTIDNPIGRVDSIESLEHLRTATTYGASLFVKHIFVLVTFVLSFWDRFSLAPRMLRTAGELESTTPPGGMLFAASAVNLAACLGVLVATARMAIELH